MQFTHLAGRKPIANYEADVMPHVGFSRGVGNSDGACLRLVYVTGNLPQSGKGRLATIRPRSSGPPHASFRL